MYNVTGNLLTAYVDSGATPGVLDGTDRQVFTLQITNTTTGAYTFTLLDQLDHGLNTNDNDEALIAIDFSSVLVAKDADGDITPLTAGAFTISVENDVPLQLAATEAKTVYEDLLAGGNPDTPANPVGASTIATGTLAGVVVSFGADQPGTITLSPTTSGLPQTLTSNGQAVVYNVTGNLLTAYVDSGATPGVLDGTDRQVFTLQITNTTTGAYTFTLLDQLDHGLNTNDNDEALIAIDFSSVLVAKDADGDITPLTAGAFTISVENDVPLQLAATEAKTVYEDLLAGGNPDTPAISVGASTIATGTLAGVVVSFGADQPGTITLSPTTSGLPQTLTSNGQAVVYNVTGNLLTAYVDSGATPGVLDGTDRQVFTLQITNTTTGAYTFTLLDQLDHGLNTNDNDEALIAIDFSSVLVAKDADGDITPLTAGAFTISVENDVPLNFLPHNAYVLNVDSTGTDHLDTRALDFAAVVGADQPGSIVFNIANNALATDANGGGTLTHAGQAIHIFGNLANTLTGYVETSGNSTYDQGLDQVIYTIQINAAADNFTVTTFELIDNTIVVPFLDLSSAKAGNLGFVSIGADSNVIEPDIILSALNAAGNPTTVNTNSNNIGIGAGQNINDATAGNEATGGEALRVDLVNHAVTAATATGFNWTDHFTATSFKQQINSVQGNGRNQFRGCRESGR